MSSGVLHMDEDDLSAAHYVLDQPAFEVFFKQHFTDFCAFCQAKFGFDLEEAKEIVHVAFIKLWEARQTITSGTLVRSYMFRVVVNTSLDLIRHQKARQKYSDFYLEHYKEACDESEINKIDFRQLAIDIQQAVNSLPEQMRRIFELSRYEGLTYAAIAAELGISVKTVETQISRALVKLRQQLGRYLVAFFFFLLALKSW